MRTLLRVRGGWLTHPRSAGPHTPLGDGSPHFTGMCVGVLGTTWTAGSVRGHIKEREEGVEGKSLSIALVLVNLPKSANPPSCLGFPFPQNKAL